VVANLTFITIPSVRDNYAVLLNILYLCPDFALRQTLFAFVDLKLYGIPINFIQFYLSMMATIVILIVILLYVCENIYARDRLNLVCHYIKMMLRCSWCKKLTKRLDGVELDKVKASHGDNEDLVEKLINDDYSVAVQRLEKKYFDVPAVCGISFTVQKGECFGILGPSGAGKTTIFNMMTLGETITNGSIEVNKVNCRNDKLMYKAQFGYCPQAETLNPQMTPYEVLKYFAWIRNVPRQKRQSTVNNWLKRFDINEFRDRSVQYLSASTKRKLSIAVAMMGFPPVIFLDEPTTGLDSKSRCLVWSCIKEFQNQKRTVVLASNSMEECEHMCNRVAILAQERFTSIGDIQQLKTKWQNYCNP
jgi:ATP-binding cassette, subfamily A (ABC1), member 3